MVIPDIEFSDNPHFFKFGDKYVPEVSYTYKICGFGKHLSKIT
jgi:hypothetical protein